MGIRHFCLSIIKSLTVYFGSAQYFNLNIIFAVPSHRIKIAFRGYKNVQSYNKTSFVATRCRRRGHCTFSYSWKTGYETIRYMIPVLIQRILICFEDILEILFTLNYSLFHRIYSEINISRLNNTTVLFI